MLYVKGILYLRYILLSNSVTPLLISTCSVLHARQNSNIYTLVLHVHRVTTKFVIWLRKWCTVSNEGIKFRMKSLMTWNESLNSVKISHSNGPPMLEFDLSSERLLSQHPVHIVFATKFLTTILESWAYIW
jgi:hypothetical protein